MQTECNGTQLEFQGIGGRRVQAEFNGGHITSDAGVLLLREVDERLGICERFTLEKAVRTRIARISTDFL